MPEPDFLKIALEHHRAGRLLQAEAGYRALIDADPNHANGLHWLGVLLYQAGQSDQAVALLERAAAHRPDDAAFQHNLGLAYGSAGRPADSVSALERAVELEPGRAETLVALAHAQLTRRFDGDADAAVAALERARAAGLDSADLHHDLGVALLAAGRATDAVASIRTAVAKNPNDAAAYHHLALAHRMTHEPREVRKSLLKALEIDPAHAAAWYALGVLDAETGNLPQAAASLRKAIRARADYPAAYHALGRVLELEGNKEEARKAFELAMRCDRGHVPRSPSPRSAPPGSVAELEQRLAPDATTQQLHFALAGLTHLRAPAHVPPAQIRALFDRYADGFDEHVRTKLNYRVPELLVEAVRAVAPDRSLDVFDLGCGTGLCGPLLRPFARTLRGIDLSPGMIEKARDRNVYDRLDVGDLVAALSTARDEFDLLTAADVLNYVGDLAPLLEAATGALRPGGLFAFTVEADLTGEQRFHLQKNIHRFAHAKPYLRHVAQIFGFVERSLEEVDIRTEANRSVRGYVVVLQKP